MMTIVSTAMRTLHCCLAAFFLVACASTSSRPSGQLLDGTEIMENIRHGYVVCMVDIVIPEQHSARTAEEIVDMAGDACTDDLRAYKQIYYDQGYDRGAIDDVFAKNLPNLRDMLVGQIKQARETGVPLVR